MTLTIYNAAGKMVRSYSGNTRAIQWDGRDSRGKSVPGGIYLARAKTADRVLTAKLMLMK
jgi:flagellar hook assembly protein FlgD